MAWNIAVPGLVLAALAAFSLAATDAWARTIENWPCRTPYAEEIPAASVWESPPKLRLAASWRDDDAVLKVVGYAVNPENNPERGKKAISALARKAGAGRDDVLVKVFTGLVEETNGYYRIVIAGIRNFIIKAKILAGAVDANDAEIRALGASEADKARRRDVKQARFWNFRNMDDAEEEAEFLCHRLSYLKKKLRRLAEHIRAEMKAD